MSVIFNSDTGGNGRLVDFNIFLDGLAPGEIGSHGILAAMAKQFGLVEQYECLADGAGQGAGGVFREFDAGGLFGVLRPIDHAIVQAAGGADHGNGSVAQAVHLVQAARFKPGRHKEEVAAGLDAMREGFIVADLDGDLVREAPGEVPIAAFVFGRAAAEDDELEVGVQHLGQCAELDIHAFLFGQPGNGAEERRGFTDRQADLLLQRAFIGRFAGEPADAVGLEQMRVFGGVPLVVINAVQDAGQPVPALAQQAVQAAAEFLGTDFAGIARADGGDGVGIGDAGFEAVQVAEIFQTVG